MSAGMRRSDRINVLAVVVGIGVGFFLAIEPVQPWLLLLTVGLVALGVDGIVRSYPANRFQTFTDTSTFLFLPVLFVLAAGLLLEYTVDGIFIPAAAGGLAAIFWVTALAEYVSVNPNAPGYGTARFLLNVVTYLTAFAFYGVIYEFDVGLVGAAFAAGLITVLLGVEILRETELEGPYLLSYAAAVGLIVGQVRWTLYFLPIESFVAALFLLVVFYFITGVLHAHFTGQLRRATVAEYSVVTLAVFFLVLVAGLATT